MCSLTDKWRLYACAAMCAMKKVELIV